MLSSIARDIEGFGALEAIMLTYHSVPKKKSITNEMSLHRDGEYLEQLDILFDIFRLLVQWSWLAPRP